jgi:PAS domain S-box-containing protein
MDRGEHPAVTHYRRPADGVVISIRDITERLAAGEAVRFQAALLASVGQAVIAIDPQGLIVYWNKAAEDMYGWSESEALNQPLAVLVPSESPEKLRDLIEACMNGTSWTGDLLSRRRDGTIIPTLSTETPMFDEHGELKALIGVSTDISERKRAEEAAQELSVIVESTADAILTQALDGTILTWNRGAEELYGYSAEESHWKEFEPFGFRSRSGRASFRHDLHHCRYLDPRCGVGAPSTRREPRRRVVDWLAHLWR